MNEIDKWLAGQCGVWIDAGYWIHNSIEFRGQWTIQDPRCREIVRERFKIETYPTHDESAWTSTAPKEPNSGSNVYEYEAEGKTIPEAEIACITAIYEAMKDE